VQRLVIGVPARNEAATIADLAGALEAGAALLGEGVRSQVVLAYQPGGDDTLARWHSLQLRIPSRVLYGTDGESGKGRNVKRLISYARETSAHLLLVDADLRSYDPSNIGQFVSANRLSLGGMVLPLWRRPRGQGNSTDFLACPLLFAMYGARVRQPLAGQMLLSKQMLDKIELDALPDDYGIDVALTMHGLNEGLPIDQVIVPFPGHDAGSNSRQIMEDVASAILASFESRVHTSRTDIRWPPQWWEGQTELAPSSRSLRGLIEEVMPAEQHSQLTVLANSSPSEVRDLWCGHLVGATRLARAGHRVGPIVADLVGPFLLHAEYRRLVELDAAEAEAYVFDLCVRLADAIS
jgi:hypothetical protein